MGEEQLGPFRLLQREGVFPLGGDALALGRFATVKPRWRVCDLGTGSGVLLLLLAERVRPLTCVGVDNCPHAVALARENLERNGLPGEILGEDVRACTLPAGAFDLVLSNPPYFQRGCGGDGGACRMASEDFLEHLCRCGARLLKNGGRFALCHRPERLTDLLCALRASGLEPKRLQFVAHTPQKPPSLVLVESVRQGRPGLEVLPTHIHHP